MQSGINHFIDSAIKHDVKSQKQILFELLRDKFSWHFLLTGVYFWYILSLSHVPATPKSTVYLITCSVVPFLDAASNTVTTDTTWLHKNPNAAKDGNDNEHNSDFLVTPSICSDDRNNGNPCLVRMSGEQKHIWLWLEDQDPKVTILSTVATSQKWTQLQLGNCVCEIWAIQ